MTTVHETHLNIFYGLLWAKDPLMDAHLLSWNLFPIMCFEGHTGVPISCWCFVFCGRLCWAVRAAAASMAAAALMETRRHACALADMEVCFACAEEIQSCSTLHDLDAIICVCPLGS